MMRSLMSFFLLGLFAVSAFAQKQAPVAPVPADPYEPATGAAQVLDTAQKRAIVFQLLNRAAQNSNLHLAGTHPFTLKASFNSSGESQFTGPGDVQETWFSGASWQWTQHLGSYSQTRIFYNGFAFDDKSSGPMPLRMQMARSAIFWPVVGVSPNDTIRITHGELQGAEVACGLFSLGGTAEALATKGRRWEETEYCIDGKTGLLRVFSEAPGIY